MFHLSISIFIDASIERPLMTLNIRQSSELDANDDTVNSHVTLINAVYQEVEGDMWKPDNSGRTYAGEVENFLQNKELLIAEIDGKIVGSIKIEHIDDNTLAFGMLVVDPDVRGKGIGRELVNSAEANARDNGYTVMQLELLTPRHWENTSKEFLKTWYTRIGYKPNKTRSFEEVSPHRMDEFATDCDFTIWLKDLT